MFNWLFKRKKKISELKKVDEIEHFYQLFNSLLEEDEFLSKQESLIPLKNKFDEIFSKYNNLHISNVLKKYSDSNDYEFEYIVNFIEDYKNIENRIKEHNDKFIYRHLIEEKNYLDNILKKVDLIINLDKNQREVILSDEDYTLVVAGAGAGKTTTVAAKVKYLVEKKNIDPKEILVISYTNKAVNELKERIQQQLKIPAIITTFHSTGNAIIKKTEVENKRIVDGGLLYKAIETYLKKEILSDSTKVDQVILFFGSYFNAPYEGDDFNKFFTEIAKSDFSTLKSNVDQYNKEIIDGRSKKKVTIKYEMLRSEEEVEIANFLYLNGIEYEYEPNYKYNFKNSFHPYTPDFLIKQGTKEIYIEHFGITEDGKHNKYSKEELEKYKNNVNDKIRLHRKHGTNLIYTFSKYKDGKDKLDYLNEKLTENGFVLEKRDSKEVFQLLVDSEENKYITRFTFLLSRFIQNFKVNGYSENDFDVLKSKSNNIRTKIFLDIAKGAYLHYEYILHKNNFIDFEDMINHSARILREKQVKNEKLGFKYIIVDEYQDISMQRFDLTRELSKVTDAKIIAVGDDWQSIYAFSGSNINLFTNFVDTVGYANRLQIVNTYRNSQEVIDIAGGFIQKNETQIKKELISPKTIEKPIIVISYVDDFSKLETRGLKGVQQEKAKAVDYALSLINKTIKDKNHKVLLIGRYNFDGYKLGETDLFDYNDDSKEISSVNYPHIDLTFLTAHSSKGLGYDDVIIINSSNERYGFPSQIEVDPVLNLVIKNDSSIDYAEERRLFYVALTRTKNRVYLATPETKPSEFVLEIINDYDLVTQIGDFIIKEEVFNKTRTCPSCGYPLQLRYNPSYGLKLYMCTNEPEVCDFITNDLKGGLMTIGKCPSCLDGYLIVKSMRKTNVSFLGCTNYKTNNQGCNHTINQTQFDKNYGKKQPKRLYNFKLSEKEGTTVKGISKGSFKFN